MSKKPILFDLEHEDQVQPLPDVADVEPVPDLDLSGQVQPPGAAMDQVLTLAQPRRSSLVKWVAALFFSLLGAMVSVAAWDFVTGLLERFPLLGWVVSAGFVVLLTLTVILILRELAALVRLGRIDSLRHTAQSIGEDLEKAKSFAQRLLKFYGARPDLAWSRARVNEQISDVMDADAVLVLSEDELLAPLDAQAQIEVERAARQVATVTALVPLALVDMLVALVSAVRMIRRIAEIYGGRSGLLGSLKLLRMVATHLMATGAMAVGDDLLEPVLGGSVLSKLSRRFGEGLVNGALTARVGLAAMEVCRPMPFAASRKPSVRVVIRRALSGLFAKEP